jgi:hypothetical protein
MMEYGRLFYYSFNDRDAAVFFLGRRETKAGLDLGCWVLPDLERLVFMSW